MSRQSKREEYIKKMLRPEGLMYNREFQFYDLKTVFDTVKTVWKEPKPADKPLDPPRMTETQQIFKPGSVRFDLFIKPNPILGVDHSLPQKPFERLDPDRRREVQKTRPRVVMTPAISLDDIEDEDRDKIIPDMYQSKKTKSERRVWEDIHWCSVKAPLWKKLSPTNPVYLPKWKPPMVPQEWKMDSVIWNRNNMRYNYDVAEAHYVHNQK